MDLAGFKAITAAARSVIKDARNDDLELVAEGDAVFARFNYVVTLHDGSTTTYRALAYQYCLVKPLNVLLSTFPQRHARAFVDN